MPGIRFVVQASASELMQSWLSTASESLSSDGWSDPAVDFYHGEDIEYISS